MSLLLKKGKNVELVINRLLELLERLLFADIFMILSLFLVKFVVPISSSVRLLNIPIILVYTIIGAGVYLLVSYKSGVIEEVLGRKMLIKIKKKGGEKNNVRRIN